MARRTDPQRAMKESWTALRAKEEIGRRVLGNFLPWKKQMKLWDGMIKAQSSLCTQVRTGHIGLCDYVPLFAERARGDDPVVPLYDSRDRETAFHTMYLPVRRPRGVGRSWGEAGSCF